jgi:hypothetical protein
MVASVSASGLADRVTLGLVDPLKVLHRATRRLAIVLVLCCPIYNCGLALLHQGHSGHGQN